MLKRNILAVLLAALAGCSEMSQEEVHAAVTWCHDSGMWPEFQDGFVYGIKQVNCVPRRDAPP